MTDLSEDTGMTSVRGAATDPVVLYLDNTSAVPQEIFEALVECAGFVNWRRLQVGQPPVLILAFNQVG